MNDAPPFPHPVGAAVNVVFDGSPWPAKVHRVAVNQRSCTVKYLVDGRMEPSVSPARINQQVQSPAAEPLQDIPEASEPHITQEVASEPFEAVAKQEGVPQVPMEDPVFTTKRSVTALNKFFAKLMKGRLKRFKHTCKWCCSLRRDMPYFAADMGENGTLQLKFAHATVDMTHGCNLQYWDNIKAVDEYLYLKGELLTEAHRISQLE